MDKTKKRRKLKRTNSKKYTKKYNNRMSGGGFFFPKKTEEVSYINQAIVSIVLHKNFLLEKRKSRLNSFKKITGRKRMENERYAYKNFSDNVIQIGEVDISITSGKKLEIKNLPPQKNLPDPKDILIDIFLKGNIEGIKPRNLNYVIENNDVYIQDIKNGFSFLCDHEIKSHDNNYIFGSTDGKIKVIEKVQIIKESQDNINIFKNNLISYCLTYFPKNKKLIISNTSINTLLSNTPVIFLSPFGGKTPEEEEEEGVASSSDNNTMMNSTTRKIDNMIIPILNSFNSIYLMKYIYNKEKYDTNIINNLSLGETFEYKSSNNPEIVTSIKGTKTYQFK